MSTCPDITRIQDHLDGLLPESEARAFRTHLERCADCVAEVALYRRVMADLGHLDTEDPGPALTERILDRVVPSRVRRKWVSIAGWGYTAATAVTTFAVISWASRPDTPAWAMARVTDLYFHLVQTALFTLHTMVAAVLRLGDGWGLMRSFGEFVSPLLRALALSFSNPVVAGVTALAVLSASLLLAWLRPRVAGPALTRKGVHHVDLLGF
jgi:anti-sigma factor RsiW